MHIAEGYLPITHCIIWFVLSGIIVIYGIYKLRGFSKEINNLKSIFAASALLMLVMSFLRFPSVTGSCTHPTGNGLGGAMLGPYFTAVLAAIILIFESLILGYGGITTLGANIFSLGIFGPFIAALIYKGLSKFNVPNVIIIIIACIFANLATYLMTSFQLVIAYPNVFSNFITILFIYLVTVLPLILIDCLVSAVVWVILSSFNSDSLSL